MADRDELVPRGGRAQVLEHGVAERVVAYHVSARDDLPECCLGVENVHADVEKRRPGAVRLEDSEHFRRPERVRSVVERQQQHAGRHLAVLLDRVVASLRVMHLQWGQLAQDHLAGEWVDRIGGAVATPNLHHPLEHAAADDRDAALPVRRQLSAHPAAGGHLVGKLPGIGEAGVERGRLRYGGRQLPGAAHCQHQIDGQHYKEQKHHQPAVAALAGEYLAGAPPGAEPFVTPYGAPPGVDEAGGAEDSPGASEFAGGALADGLWTAEDPVGADVLADGLGPADELGLGDGVGLGEELGLGDGVGL